VSKRQSIIGALRTRLEAITVDNGFQTDAGARIYTGQAPSQGPDEPTAALAIVAGDDSTGHQGEHVVVTWPLQVVALVKADVDEPLLALEAVVADIKTAVELADRTFGGLLVARGLTRGNTRVLPREDGSEYVGASVEYQVVFAERWGEP
jgi:hypothetical protein